MMQIHSRISETKEQEKLESYFINMIILPVGFLRANFNFEVSS